MTETNPPHPDRDTGDEETPLLIEKLDLFLDGDLSAADHDAFLTALGGASAFRDSVRDQVLIGAALEGLPAATRIPLPSTASRRLRWIGAAAAVVVAFLSGLWVAGSDGIPDRGMDVDVLWAGAVVTTSDVAREVAFDGGERAVVAPRSEVAILEGGDRPTLQIRRGSVEVLTARSPVIAQVQGIGDAVSVEGLATLTLVMNDAADASARHPMLLVTPFRGGAVVGVGDGAEEIPDGETWVLQGNDRRPLFEIVSRLAELDGDEGVVVLTTRDRQDLMDTLDRDRERLEGLLGTALADRERLSMELEAVRDQHPTARPTLRDLLEATAKNAEAADLDDRETTYRHWRRIKCITKRRKSEEILPAVKDVLFADGANEVRQRLGLMILRTTDDPQAAEEFLRFTDHPKASLRAAALEGLARDKDLQDRARHRDLFARVWQQDDAVEVQVIAAGGLVSLGDYGEPLAWLLQEHGKDHPDDLKHRILGRILDAPLDLVGAYAVQCCARTDLPARTADQVVFLLSNLRTEQARGLLREIAVTATRNNIRTRALLAGQR
jgi:hypothetical protein